MDGEENDGNDKGKEEKELVWRESDNDEDVFESNDEDEEEDEDVSVRFELSPDILGDEGSHDNSASTGKGTKRVVKELNNKCWMLSYSCFLD